MTEKAPRLLIRLGSMGDVVLATAAASAWKRVAPDAPLDVLVKTEWAALWDGHPSVRRVIRWPDGGGLDALRRIAAELRADGYRLALDLQGSARTRVLTTLAGIPTAARPPRYSWRRRLLVQFKRGGPPPGFGVLASFVSAADPGASDLPALYPGEEARARARRLLGTGSPVALIPGAKHATKRWPLERFAALGRRLVTTGHGPVAVCLEPGDAAIRRSWAQAWGGEDGWIPVAETLPTTAAVLGACSAAVTGDTGLMHMAAAVGTPVVAVFGPTVRGFGFSPVGPGHRVLETDLACRPCSVHGSSSCPKGHFRCMLGIEIAEVEEAVRLVASSTPARL